MMSAAASQGLLFRWDIDNGLNNIDKFLYVGEDFIKVNLFFRAPYPSWNFYKCMFQAGSLLALGIISNGVHHECDPAQALLLDYVRSDKQIFRTGSILG